MILLYMYINNYKLFYTHTHIYYAKLSNKIHITYLQNPRNDRQRAKFLHAWTLKNHMYVYN